MTNIRTSSNKTFLCGFIGIPIHSPKRLFFEIDDDRMLSDVAAEFEGLQYIEKTDDVKPGEIVKYEGFSVLSGVQRNEDGSVRVTLTKP